MGDAARHPVNRAWRLDFQVMHSTLQTGKAQDGVARRAVIDYVVDRIQCGDGA